MAMPLRRKLVWSAVCVVAFFAILEGAAWIVDSRWHFRESVLRVLDQGEVVHGPIAAQPDTSIDLPPRTIWIRGPFRGTPSGEPYVAGGRVIPGMEGGFELHQDHVTPEDLQARDGGAKRVFVLGESAAFGFPYRHEQSFAALLDEGLRPRGCAVYNAAVCAWTSGRLMPLLRRIVDHFQPYAVVIYCGNNEWIHWAMEGVPYQNMLEEKWANQARLAVWKRMGRSRAAAALEYFMIAREAKRQLAAREPPDGNYPTLREAQFALDHPLDDYFEPSADWWHEARQSYLDTFEANLRTMVDYARRHGVHVLLLTVPFNPKLCPAWACPQPESLDPAHRDKVRANIHAAAELVRDRQYRPALSLLDETLKLDPRPPIPHYLRGQCLEGLGESLKAEAAYALSRENMIGHLGCRLSANKTITRVAASARVDLIDVARLFDDYEHAHGKFFNEDLIHDTCHPTPLGHRLIADAVTAALSLPQVP